MGMVDCEIEVTVRECSECKHYLGGSMCRAFDEIPFELFTDAAKHDRPLPNQKENFTFEAYKKAAKIRIFADNKTL